MRATKVPPSGHIQVHKATMARLCAITDEIVASGAKPAECTRDAIIDAALIALIEKRKAQKNHDEVYGRPAGQAGHE